MGAAGEPAVEIRHATRDDLDALVDIYLAGARHHAAIDPAAFRVPERADVAVRLGRRLDASGPDHAYVAAVVAGQLVGSATMDIDVPHPGAMYRPIRSAELGPETFQKSAYVGRFGWITVDLDRVDPALLSTLIRDAWRRTAPKRLAATLEEPR